MKIRLNGVGKRIASKWLVRDVSFKVKPNCVTAIVGPNGSGKSTVLKLLAGLWKPTEGTVWVDGENASILRRRFLASRIGYVAQDSRIDAPFSVMEAVSMGRHPHLGRFESPGPRDRSAVRRALARADVLDLADRTVNNLSGGEFQRVAIARCLATEAETIVLDEPTASLDLEHSLGILSLLRELAAEGRSVVVALHDLNAVARWADHAVVLHRGRLRVDSHPSAVLRDRFLEEVFDVDAEHLRSSRGVPVLVFHPRSRAVRHASEERSAGDSM